MKVFLNVIPDRYQFKDICSNTKVRIKIFLRAIIKIIFLLKLVAILVNKYIFIVFFTLILALLIVVF